MKTEPVYRLFGAKIEQTRSILGWSQADLAKKVGLTRGSIANIETFVISAKLCEAWLRGECPASKWGLQVAVLGQ